MSRPDYVFEARIQKASSGPTFLEFASPTSLYGTPLRVPSILREFGHTQAPRAGGVKAEPDPTWTSTVRFSGESSKIRERSSTRSFSEISSARATSRARSMASRTPTPALSFASPSPPSFAPSTPASTVSTVVASRAASDYPQPTFPSVSRPGTPPRYDFPPENFGDFLPPTSRAGVVTRSVSSREARDGPRPISGDSKHVAPILPLEASAYGRNHRACQPRDEEKTAARKGKSKARHLETAWWELKRKKAEQLKISTKPLLHPADLKSAPELQIGDLFVHRSTRGLQIWVWSESASSSGVWVPVLLGYTREEDGRMLGLTPSHNPSFVLPHWYNRQKSEASVEVFKLS